MPEIEFISEERPATAFSHPIVVRRIQVNGGWLYITTIYRIEIRENLRGGEEEYIPEVITSEFVPNQ